MAKLPYSFLTRDRFGPSRVLASPRDGRAHLYHAPSHTVRREDAQGEAASATRWRGLSTPVQSLSAVSLALAAVVVLLWQGSLVLLAAGALVLGLLSVAVFLIVARRAAARQGDMVTTGEGERAAARRWP